MIDNIIGSVIQNQMYGEMDAAYESVLDFAMEADHVIDPKTRDSIPDDQFGIPKYRKYPLVIKKDRDTTHKLVTKSIQMFHYCRPDWKKELATNILKAIKEEKLDIKIDRKSQICKHVDVPEEYLQPAKD